ncbi:Glycoside hydrolase superfamily [Penicillium verrucosum]|uniref:Glycoside hydrolase superfamily n=1 Tax=Penicillium verrucosum TaxID=60171 RepID=UPI0025450DE5|nr:Glycoside hydrolase superfamily [Penicillium verrucosum]KAJ5941649.1 Glycoside hydrolase superfamily [Penicillium verrucosum]
MNADISNPKVNFTWQMDVFKQYAAVLDSMAGYSNLLGLLIGSEIVAGPDMEDQGSTVHLAPYLKAAARDMKAYTAAMQHRSIPIGYATSAEYTYMQDLGEYLVCGVAWQVVHGGSRYDDLTSKLESLAVPIFLSEDGCNIPVPQLLRDQSATFEPNMPSIWSGAIVYEWREEGSNDGLVSYTTSGVSTPTTLAGYDALKSKWSAVPANTQPPSTFSSLSCPTSINPHWSINPSAALPTIAGLDFATITPVGVIGTAHGTRTLTSRSTPSSNPKSKHDVGVMAGIGVGVGLGVVLIFAAVITFFVRRHRKKRAINTGSSVTETSDTLGAGIPDPSAPLTEMSHTAPSGDLVYAGSPSGLPGSDLRSQELNSVVAHKVHKEEV